MFYFLVTFLLVNLSPVDMNGIWKLPIKEVEAQLLIFHPSVEKQKYNTLAIIRLNPSCKKPVELSLRGNVIRSGKDTVIALESKEVPLPNKCTYQFMMMATGKIFGNVYKAKGVVISVVKCNGKLSKRQVDRMDGIWIRIFNPRGLKDARMKEI